MSKCKFCEAVKAAKSMYMNHCGMWTDNGDDLYFQLKNGVRFIAATIWLHGDDEKFEITEGLSFADESVERTQEIFYCPLCGKKLTEVKNV